MGDLTRRVQGLLDRGVSLQIGSAVAAGWGHLGALANGDLGDTVFSGKTSHERFADTVGANTVFDLASLTKVLATASLYMIWDELGIIRVEAPLSDFFPALIGEFPHLRGVTFAHLLSHTSGLPAWKPFFETTRRDFETGLPFAPLDARTHSVYSQLLQVPRELEPGNSVIYSDLGFLLLGHLAELLFQKSTQESLDQLVQRWVWSRVRGLGLHFRPVHTDANEARKEIVCMKQSVAMTEACPWRGMLQGQVHDDNSWSMGGISGHAGVFGTLNDVLLWIGALINGEIVSFQTLQKFLKAVDTPVGARRTLGFDMPALDGSGTTAFALTPGSVGHLGFTGTSLWLDLDRDRYAVLLTNRVHPSRNDLRIRELRRMFHTTIC